MDYTLTNTSNGWRFLDLNGNAYSGNDSLINELTEAIGIISSSKKLPKELFETIATDENRTVEVKAGNKTFFSPNGEELSNGCISWNYINPDAVLTISGETSRNKVSNLLHEFAHAYYTWHINSKQEEWFNYNGTSVNVSELYTTHIENIFRGELGLGIRCTYESYETSTDGPPLHPLVDRKGRSFYYDKSGEFHRNGFIKKKNRYVY